MTTSFTIRHTFDTDLDTYWSKVFFDDEYNRRLYLEGLKFHSFEVIEKTGEPGKDFTRKIRTEPNADAPAVVRKLIGDSLAYVESGRFDPKARRWSYTVTTSKLAEKIKINGDFWAEARGDKKVERFCTVNVDVSIFGVGRVVEGFIEKTTRESYDRAAVFTNTFIREKKL